MTENEDGCIPNVALYDGLANGLFRLAGRLLSYSLYQKGPAPNFFSPWIFDFIIGGVEKVLSNLPQKVPKDAVPLEAYNQVYYIIVHTNFIVTLFYCC